MLTESCSNCDRHCLSTGIQRQAVDCNTVHRKIPHDASLRFMVTQDALVDHAPIHHASTFQQNLHITVRYRPSTSIVPTCQYHVAKGHYHIKSIQYTQWKSVSQQFHYSMQKIPELITKYSPFGWPDTSVKIDDACCIVLIVILTATSPITAQVPVQFWMPTNGPK